MQEIIQTIAPIIVTSFMTYVVWVLQNLKKKKDYQSDALKLLMKKELRELHAIYMKAGEIDVDDLSNVEQLYEAYHGLGGNGTGTKMYEEIKKLPIKEE